MEHPFHAYDVRAIYLQDIDEDFAYLLGRATARFLKGKRYVVGRDCRLSSPALSAKLIAGILDEGIAVDNIELCSTPQFYFALYNGTADGGIMVTASHNPKEYNGFKICGANATPIFADNGLENIQEIMKHMQKTAQTDVCNTEAQERQISITENYIKFFAHQKKFLSKPYTILVDCGNGMGGKEISVLRALYGNNVKITTLYEDMDGTFPNHEANPVKQKNTQALVQQLREGTYDFGCALDGDADRIVFFTSQGEKIESDILTAVLGVFLSDKNEGIAYEVRTSQSAIEYITKHNRKNILCKSGRPYITKGMQENNCVFGGEKSGHHFFQLLHNTDSTLLMMMSVLHMLDATHKTLGELALPVQRKRYSTEEINYTVTDADATIAAIKEAFASEADIKEIDGVSVYTQDYFFNIRKSNTEPLVRLNLETANKDVYEPILTKIEQIIHKNK